MSDMIYKVANIFGCHYDERVNKYVLGVLLARDGKGKDTRLFFNTKEEAERIEIGELIEYSDEGNKKTKGKQAESAFTRDLECDCFALAGNE